MKKAWVIHPFFFSLFPILALYAHNVRSLPIPFVEVAGPLAVSVAGAGLFFSYSSGRAQGRLEIRALRVPVPALVLFLWPYRRPDHGLDRGHFQPVVFLRHGPDRRPDRFSYCPFPANLHRALQDPQRRLPDSRRHQPCFGRADPGPPAAGRHTRRARGFPAGCRSPQYLLYRPRRLYPSRRPSGSLFLRQHRIPGRTRSQGVLCRFEELRELRLHLSFSGVVPEFHLSRRPCPRGR